MQLKFEIGENMSTDQEQNFKNILQPIKNLRKNPYKGALHLAKHFPNFFFEYSNSEIKAFSRATGDFVARIALHSEF